MSMISLLGEADKVVVTTIVDNVVDLFAPEGENVKRLFPGGLIAEHGLAFLVEVEADGRGRTVLMDTGSSQALLNNLSRLKIETEKIDAIVISHGHPDHTGGLLPLLKDLNRSVPVIAHPDAVRPSVWIRSLGRVRGPYLPPSEGQVEEAGGRLILTKGAFPLFTGTVTSGEAERREEYEGLSRVYYVREETMEESPIRDDQSLVVRVKDKGLVVLSGCGHSGIVNTVRHAQRLAEVGRVYAVLGGFHLVNASDMRMDRTIEALRSIGPKILSPMHCAGFKFMSRVAHELPESFVQNCVGTRIEI